MLGQLASGAKRILVDRRHRLNLQRSTALDSHDGLRPQLWDASVSAAGHLEIGGCDLTELAARFGTPLLVLDRGRLEADYRRFRDAFERLYPKVEICYSYKTNPLPGALAVLHELGALAEVISHFELWLALSLGVSPESILLNGPGKGEDAIELAVERGVKLINIDSLDEIELVAAAARRHGRRQAVGVRVVTSVGWSSQFGLSIAEGEALEAYRRLTGYEELLPVGLHVHLGTAVRELRTYLQAIREVLTFVRRVRNAFGVDLSYLDLGGGFAVPTVRPYDAWDYRLMRHSWPPAPIDYDSTPTPDEYAAAIIQVVRDFYPATSDAQPTVAFEPGRALTSSAQCLLLRAITVKRGRRRTPAVILDGGKNLAPPTAYEHHELLPVTRAAAKRGRRYNFFGPLCHPGDELFIEQSFPEVVVGDLVAIMDAGAYFVPNQTNFSHPRPAAVIVDHGTATLLRKRETFEDVVRNDHWK